MLKRIAIIGAVFLILVMIPGSYFGLKDYCSLEHRGNNKNSQSSGTSEQHAPPQVDQAEPTATFNLSITDPGKIEGRYYAKGEPKEKGNWTEKFWCDAKIGEFALVVFTFLLVVFTGGLWFSTNRLWAVTNDTLSHAQRASEDELRPYVNVAGASYEWGGKEGAGFRFIVECLNSGQTPATFFDVGGVSAIGIVGDVARDITIPSELKYNTWISLGAGSRETVGIRDTDFPSIAREVLESSGSKFFMLLGRVRYGDVFGNEYESEFVFFTKQLEVNTVVKMSRGTGRFKTYHQTKKA